MVSWFHWLSTLMCVLVSRVNAGNYLIGTGIGDMTSSIAEGAFMGYAAANQVEFLYLNLIKKLIYK